MLLISCFVVCVAAQSYSHVIVLKPNHYSEIEVDCSQGDLLKIEAKSVNGNYFTVEILNPWGQTVFSKKSYTNFTADYPVPASGEYRIRIASGSENAVTVLYTINTYEKIQK